MQAEQSVGITIARFIQWHVHLLWYSRVLPESPVSASPLIAAYACVHSRSSMCLTERVCSGTSWMRGFRTLQSTQLQEFVDHEMLPVFWSYFLTHNMHACMHMVAKGWQQCWAAILDSHLSTINIILDDCASDL